MKRSKIISRFDISLPDLRKNPPHNVLTEKELDILQKARRGSTNNIGIFSNLLKYAELDASKEKMSLKNIPSLFCKRKSITFNIYDKETKVILGMNFSFPSRFINLILKTPISKLLSLEGKEIGIPQLFYNRLKKDLTVFKIIASVNGKYSGPFCLNDFRELG